VGDDAAAGRCDAAEEVLLERRRADGQQRRVPRLPLLVRAAGASARDAIVCVCVHGCGGVCVVVGVTRSRV
jgi:hypothetical protein